MIELIELLIEEVQNQLKAIENRLYDYEYVARNPATARLATELTSVNLRLAKVLADAKSNYGPLKTLSEIQQQEKARKAKQK